MTASSNKKLVKTKDQVIHVGGVNHPLFTRGYKGVSNIINEYHGFTTYPANPSLWDNFFFKSSSLKEEILLLARYAAPLETVEAHVRKAHERKEAHLPETLVQATIQAIRDGDVTLMDDEKKEICEGMAERLMGLCSKLYPDQYAQCLKQVRAAIPVEDEKQKNEREGLNQVAIKNVFDAIKKNDKDTHETIKNFKAWAKTTSIINRIHLIYLARVELAERGSELAGRWYGKLGDRFCYEVIGDALQREDLSPCMQKMLRVGIYYIFNRVRELVRETGKYDDYSANYFIRPNNSIEIGVSGFYDEFGQAGVYGRTATHREVAKFAHRFLKLITDNYISIQSLLHPSRVRTYESEMCDPVGIRRSPAANAASQ